MNSRGWRLQGGAGSKQASTSRRLDCQVPRVSVEPIPAVIEQGSKLKGYLTLQEQRAALRNQYVREGHYEHNLMAKQANKVETDQGSILEYLAPFRSEEKGIVAVVGCGPAGLALAAGLATEGVPTVVVDVELGVTWNKAEHARAMSTVVLYGSNSPRGYDIGPDNPFVNNYGVWVDEFEELGLAHTLGHTWEQTLCYFGDERKELNRAYGKVDRALLRHELLLRCQQAGVKYLQGEVVDVDDATAGGTTLHLKDGSTLQPRLNVLATGQLAGRYLQYETNAPSVASQTAYGIEADVEGYGDAFDPACMLFMDYRRHHTGVWDNGAANHKASLHLNGPPALAATGEVPSFLYAMPLTPKRVFLEETCLVARPALPFAVLKRRLMRRLDALGIKVVEVHDEEWSYIPVGGPLPVRGQSVTAFGAAANLVHPATGYSITRSLQEAPQLAKEIAKTVNGDAEAYDVAAATWDKLWPTEKRKQASFHVFGMELFTNMDLELLADFFSVFFRLPDHFWRGFLASRLPSVQLMAFALLTWVMASNRIRVALVRHLFTDPSGAYMAKYFTTEMRELVAKLSSQAHDDDLDSTEPPKQDGTTKQ